jgi:DNA-binding NarL/FixJ family response regulator
MIRLVLLDDHKVILDGLSSLLASDSDLQIEELFQKPQEAMVYLDNHTVDVLLTDLDMPEMKGEEVLTYCKSKFPSMKVIVLSMHNESAVIKHLIQSGADGYLVKSAGKAEIIQAIKNVHGGSKHLGGEALTMLTSPQVKEPVSNPQLEHLSKREIEIIRLTANGSSSKEIGEQLFISPRTVETHRNNIIKKLEIKGIAGMIRYAFTNGLIE